MESCPFEASTKELPSNGLSSSSSSRSRQGLLGGLFIGVDDRHKGSALDVPTPTSLQETVAWTPVNKINFTRESNETTHNESYEKCQILTISKVNLLKVQSTYQYFYSGTAESSRIAVCLQIGRAHV